MLDCELTGDCCDLRCLENGFHVQDSLYGAHKVKHVKGHINRVI